MPGGWRRRHESTDALVDGEDVAFQRSKIRRALNSGPQLLGDDGTEVLEWCPCLVKSTERVVRGPVAKGVDEELGVEHVRSGRGSHGSASGDAIRTPIIACVPRTSSRWNTTRSKARSMVSVAVEAPRAFCAALSFPRGNRYVRDTLGSRARVRVSPEGGVEEMAIPQRIDIERIRQYVAHWCYSPRPVPGWDGPPVSGAGRVCQSVTDS